VHRSGNEKGNVRFGVISGHFAKFGPALHPKAYITHALVAPQVRKSEFQNGALFVRAITNFLLCPELATAFESLEFGACR
jgi:hypothetical protein